MLVSRRVVCTSAFCTPLLSRRLPQTVQCRTVFTLPTRPPSCVMMTAVDEDEAVDAITKGPDSPWDIASLKKEVSRLTLRSIKKLGKANTKLLQARQVAERLMADQNATVDELDQCPNIEAVELELRELRERHEKLTQLDGLLHGEKKRTGHLSMPIFELVEDVGVSDEPPPRPQRGPGKQKGPRESTAKRLPYRRYFCVDKTEIRVSDGFGCPLLVMCKAGCNC